MAKSRELAFSMVLAYTLLAPSWVAGSGDDACEHDIPLLVVEWDALPLNQGPLSAGQWRLPISSQKPDVLTEARVEMRILKGHPTDDWRAQLHFTFPDPKPLGIPFSFQKAELSWSTAEGILTHRIDWSNACTDPGHGLFPRQEWRTELELSGTRSMGELVHPVLRLWGSRN